MVLSTKWKLFIFRKTKITKRLSLFVTEPPRARSTLLGTNLAFTSKMFLNYNILVEGKRL